ncbi:hypothetical protein [Halorientalis regularis]|jgi:hypothetical protein|uniref:hypothetical protein n=1 Tax=Halorientalis regularis TaxID=660518 RepID=UPI0011143624|nr:hypothetical protein [Halorientalis regularis]
MSLQRHRLVVLILPMIVLAGCSGAPTQYPEDASGPTHIELKNCFGDRDVTVQLTVTYVDTDEIVHDVDHRVAEGFCSDMGQELNVHEVWTDAGQYRVQATIVNGTGSFNRTFQVTPSQSDEAGDDLQLVATSDGFDSAVDPEGAISDATPTRAPEDHSTAAKTSTPANASTTATVE